MNARTVVLVVGEVVAVFRDWPGRCVVHKPRRRHGAVDDRCRQRISAGLPGAPELVDVDGGRILAIRLEGEIGERLLAQRCFRHPETWHPSAAVVDWTPFDPERDVDLVEGP
ncbi:hypothetical protein [Nonomuraea sp. NEAU-A123]|uniref:hypothetical protein n=1 Tax=Nonomuraea sp. NEAU-A123 TaxID=2839649 RepID=UPI001BE465F2|nr:hypothetical protein [Nonomuraea sp. NEAU-A123]MBT2226226.1 hypothetical protein [Nonomuraea sp. NEAU-A123]